MTSRKDNLVVEDEDDDYDKIPLQHQRPFGAGLHKKPIAFVSASGTGQLKSVDDSAAGRPQQNVADIYLSLVLSEDTTRPKSAPPTSSSKALDDKPPPQTETCPVCKLPLQTDTDTGTTHAQSFAHQVCLPHSQTPSALDRTRMGLAYLSTYGWDPDARRGLGAEQQGIKFPIKAKVKDDKLGIGIQVPKGLPPPPPKKKAQLLDAKKVRKMAEEERKKGARIRQELFGDGKLEKYLGGGAAG
ncbi:hypothetical protein CHGG_04740 [Chaetomium globosum CBS 148.51]|uniref:G-patch domain-containing protein n=1 Tax=Chaetomium globosum (strain ATCC 6205 / CBS 148.51 / DSM 1962 / NBRC 6347 / NRRL 1970) TaxID=306901 RepID=Q2H0F6_CHAGB|nr:uncharacterized protein CHGG_04740 [Chaetomium globosum CBS 148.51]EAQ88121.1 hypothetical protein CHGG_04740 [Chaetomium globosum CBS 148.51]